MVFPYLECVVGFMVCVYLLETYLHLRQHKVLELPHLPSILRGIVTDEKFKKSRAYSLDKSKFHLIHSTWGIIEECASLWFMWLPWFWMKSGAIATTLHLNPENETIHTLLFLTVVSLFSQVLELPFTLYYTFVIEERHGFNKQTVWLFLKDMLLGFLLTAAIGPPIVAGVIYIMQRSGPYIALYLWSFTLVLSLLIIVLYPILIAPLFNKFTPLPENALRKKIEDLASSLRFPLKKLFVMDGSRRSSHSNAYMYGFYKSKRIVLFDTLVQQCKEDEVVAVIAHELGHWKLSHTMYSFIATQLLTLLQCVLYMFIRNSEDLFESFGFKSQPVFIGFLLFQHTVIPVTHVFSFLMNLVSRSFEFQADAFAAKLGYVDELRNGLIKLQVENLSAMNTDPWYSAYNYSHPPLVERLAALDKLEKKGQ